MKDWTAMGDKGESGHDRGILAHLTGRHFWWKQSPYILLLILTLVGVGYSSFAEEPTISYWMFLALAYAGLCIASGWNSATEQAARLRLIWTQVLHWGAVLVAMNILLLPNVAVMANVDATGQAILLVLAVGTFLAGVHIPSWELRFLGVVMAAAVPALAWLEESALFLVLALSIFIGIGSLIWLRWRHWREGHHRGHV
jgi:hypothetical protein